MTRTVRTSIASVLGSSVFFTLFAADAAAQFRPRPAPIRAAPPPVRSAPARPAPIRSAPIRSAPLRPSPTRPGLRANIPRAPIANPPRPRGVPSNAIQPLFPTGGLNGGAAPTPRVPALPSPITLTLDSITADPEEKKQAREEAEEFFRLHVPARKAAPAMRKLTKLKWHKKISTAVAEARKSKKPILWIQALGDLKGYT